MPGSPRSSPGPPEGVVDSFIIGTVLTISYFGHKLMTNWICWGPMSRKIAAHPERTVLGGGTVPDVRQPHMPPPPPTLARSRHRREFLVTGESAAYGCHRAPVFCLLLTGAARRSRRPASPLPGGLLQMVEQGDDAVRRRFGDGIGDVAPAPVEAAGGDRVLLVDLADLAAVGADPRPAHRHLLLAFAGRSPGALPRAGEMLAGRGL